MKIIREELVHLTVDILEDLLTLADPSDYSREEVNGLIRELTSLEALPVQKTV